MNSRTRRTLGRGVANGVTMLVWLLMRILLVYLLLSVTRAYSEPNDETEANSPASAIIRSRSDGRLLNSAKSSRDMYPNRLDVLVVVNNRTNLLRLTKHLDLLAPSYKEVYFENGRRIANTLSLESKDFCYYEGIVDSDPESHAAINLCNEKISGTVYFNGLRYDVSPTSGSHLLYLIPASAVDDVSNSNYTCGHVSKTSSTNSQPRVKRAANQVPAYYKKYTNWKDLCVEMAIVFDNSVYRTVGGDKTRLFSRAKEYASFINSYYQPVNIKVALVGVEVWSESDRVTVTENGDTSLDSFLRYRRVHLLPDMPNDHAQLITMVPFGGGVVGKAMKGTVCSLDLSGAVIMEHSRNPATVAATMAHEMGHNFGMEHDNDTCQCPQPRCLMAASSSGASNMYWSSCSMEHLAWTIAHGGDFCLKNRPTSLFDSKSPVCGNGFVEHGEACDCGLPGVCDNPCCNATTCQLAEGAICASGGCCDTSTCKFKPAAAVCRDSRGECDLPEYCSGQSEICPNDTYKQNGVSCSGGHAYCYNGSCDSHDSQCKLIWGSTGAMGASECYGLNARGDMQGNCGYKRLDGSYTPCPERDIMCGSLQCSQKTERTQYGDRSLVRMAYTEIRYQNRVTICHTASIDLGSEENDPGLVPGGAKCGDGKMCTGRKCVSVEQVLAEKPCEKANCRGNGVCNNFGHCHCNIGFGGPDCGSIGLGGSVDSGPASTGEPTTITTRKPVQTSAVSVSRQTTGSLALNTSTTASTVSALPEATTVSPLPEATTRPLLNDNGSLSFPVNHNSSDSDSGSCILFEACNGFNIGLGVLIFVIVILPLVSALLTYLYKRRKTRSPKIVKVFDKPNPPKNVRSKPRPLASTEKKATTAATTTAVKTPSVQPTTPKQPNATLPVWPPTTTASCAVTSTSKSFPKPTVTVSLQDGLLPVIVAIAASNTTLNTTSSTAGQSFAANSGPARPRRPTDDRLAKVHEIDETSATNFDDVALDEDDLILPRRAAPPPPSMTTNEEANGSAQVTAPVSLADVKRVLEAARNEDRSTPIQSSAAPYAVKKPTQEKSASVSSSGVCGDSSQKAKSQLPGLPSKPLLPPSKPKVVQQQDPAPPKSENNVSYSVVEKKTKPPLLPPSKPSVVSKKMDTSEPSAMATAQQPSNAYYDVVHSKPEPPQPPKKEPVLPKKPLKPTAQLVKDEKPVNSQQPPAPETSSAPGSGATPVKSAFVADLEKRLKADSGAPSSSTRVATGKKALVPPGTQLQTVPNKEPAVPRKSSGAKVDGGRVSALASRFEKAQN